MLNDFLTTNETYYSRVCIAQVVLRCEFFKWFCECRLPSRRNHKIFVFTYTLTIFRNLLRKNYFISFFILYRIESTRPVGGNCFSSQGEHIHVQVIQCFVFVSFVYLLAAGTDWVLVEHLLWYVIAWMGTIKHFLSDRSLLCASNCFRLYFQEILFRPVVVCHWSSFHGPQWLSCAGGNEKKGVCCAAYLQQKSMEMKSIACLSFFYFLCSRQKKCRRRQRWRCRRRRQRLEQRKTFSDW